MSHEVILKSHHGSYLTAEGDKLKGHEKETEHSCWTLGKKKKFFLKDD